MSTIQCPNCGHHVPMSLWSKKIGKIKTEAKAISSARNGKLGGAPKGNQNWKGKRKDF